MVRRVKPAGAAGGTPAELRAAKPWRSFAVSYFKAGWCPLPLPPRRKSSPPTGATGKYPVVGKAILDRWLKEYDEKGNIGIRVPDNVIGIDVDAYDKKIGRASLAQLEADLGPLPATWTLTARADGVSGIRFFQVPAGLHWPGEPIADVQIVQHHHRYAVAYPSVHPDTKGIYRWYPPGSELNGRPGVTVDHEIPAVIELVPLGARWVEALTGGRVWKGLATDTDATVSDLFDWIKARPANGLCRTLAREVDRVVEELGVGGAHDRLNAGIYSVVCLASEGHSGVLEGLQALRDAFYDEVCAPGRKGRRSARSAEAEFNRARDGAIRIMMGSIRDGESVLEEECTCAGSSVAWGEKLGIGLRVEDGPDGGGIGRVRAKLGRALPADKYTMDDSGNAEHLLDVVDGSAWYVPAEKSWHFWSDASGCWMPDELGGQIIVAAQLVGKRQRELALDYNERLVSAGSSVAKDVGGELAGRISALSRHAKTSSSYGGLRNMAAIAAAQPRAHKAAEAFDADARLLACCNGTVVLDPDSGVLFRAAARADLCSLTTGTEFVPGARFGAWERYLRRFLPDAAARGWLQRLVGYALEGGNPERVMAFLVGQSSTGKTTFINAIMAALGGYAGPMNLSLFRDNQDEKPRADLVRALGRRVLCASEASAEWFLHGDQIKRLTGGDPIVARLLYSSVYVARVPMFVPFVATNNMPQIHGADKALRRRIVQMRFDSVVAVESEDHRAAAALLSPEGRRGVLAWAVRGWELYRERGIRDMPDSVRAATAKMHAELSDLDVFLGEVYEESNSPSAWVSAPDMYERWRIWVAENDVIDRMSAVKFGREINARGYPAVPRKEGGRVGKTVRMRPGLRLRNS
jgi:P4 family phage/plasmid primase-like protien